MDKINRRRQRKMMKLRALIETIRPSIIEQINTLSNRLGVDCSLSNCTIMNGLAYQRLLDNDFTDATLEGGKAAFGFNKGQFGMFDLDANAHGAQVDINGGMQSFPGHCWVEIKSLNVIVDLTLPDLPKLVKMSNEQQGIKDDEFLLDTNMIIKKEDTFTRQQIFNGSIGCFFEPNTTLRDFAHNRLNFVNQTLA
ncbi:hypothetical protein F7U66_01405 [Vibrio parahaemolyticus]|nr:hypothetical protein [Vibrio parahaemolyticus]